MRSEYNELQKVGGLTVGNTFRSLGICHDECNFKNSHKTLVGETAEDWRKLCLFCKDEKKRRQHNGK
jgi:hypothetical protein